MLTVFIVVWGICIYLAVALAVYILLLRFTDFDADDAIGMALLWLPVTPFAAVVLVGEALIWVFLEIEKQIRGRRR